MARRTKLEQRRNKLARRTKQPGTPGALRLGTLGAPRLGTLGALSLGAHQAR